MAGNFQEGKIRIRIINPALILAGGGIQIKGIFFPGWALFLTSLSTLSVAGFLIFWYIKKKRENVRIRLYKEIKEAEKEIEDVREAQEKLRRLRIMEEKAGQEWQRLKENLDKEKKK